MLTGGHSKTFVPLSKAEAVIHIPLNTTWLKDRLVWNFTLNGIYTVKNRDTNLVWTLCIVLLVHQAPQAQTWIQKHGT